MRRILPMLMIFMSLAMPAIAAETFTYHGAEGRIAEYRLNLIATGQQMSLGVRRPVKVEVEYALYEEVLPATAEGALSLKTSGQVVKLTDKTSAFAGVRFDFPPIQWTLSPRGEVLSIRPLSEKPSPPLPDRATAALLLPPAVILPEGPVEIGASWDWEKEGVKQTNRLQEMMEGAPRVARLITTERAPLSIREKNDPLGITVEVTGRESSTGTVDFSPEFGLALRHQGNSAMHTNTQVTLQAADGPHTFQMELDLRVVFDLKLVRLDGVAIAARE